MNSFNAKLTQITILLLIGSSCCKLLGQNLSDNLLLYYNFNGNVNDHSNNNLDGILVGASYTSSVNGEPNSAILFGGSDYVDLPESDLLEIEFPITVALWMRVDEQSFSVLTTDHEQNIHSGVWFSLSENDSRLAVNYGNASTVGPNSRRTFVCEATFPFNEWVHVIGIVRGFDDMEIIIDCESCQGSYTGSAKDLNYTSNPGSIGRKDSNTMLPEHYFNGAMDELHIWNRDLTLEEIEKLCDRNYLDINDYQSVTANLADVISFGQNRIIVNNNEGHKNLCIDIYSSSGQHLIHENIVGHKEINLETLSAGIYVINIYSQLNSEQLKFGVFR
jgi:hypothetical protein